jgi:hypothetical protein
MIGTTSSGISGQLSNIYSIFDIEIKDTTDTARCASYLDLYLDIGRKRNYSIFPL